MVKMVHFQLLAVKVAEVMQLIPEQVTDIQVYQTLEAEAVLVEQVPLVLVVRELL